MSADGREFVDANVLVYACDSSAGSKHTAALTLVERLWDTGHGCASVQVLQEFFVTVTRKVAHPLSIDDAAERLREFSAWTIFAPDAGDVLDAIALHKQARINFWDAMIVQAASELGCGLLWSEDLAHGSRAKGATIQNPFA